MWELVNRILKGIIRRIETNRLIVAARGNTLGASTSKLWYQHHHNCKDLYADKYNSFASLEATLELKTFGMTSLGRIDCSTLSGLITARFELLGKRSISDCLPRETTGDLAKGIYLALRQVAPLIENYYQSHFQPYWISIQQNFPGEIGADSSYGWHIDDCPKGLMKVFIYFNDVTESNGAFRAFPYKHTRSMQRSGFKSWTPEARVASQSLVSKYLKKHPDSLKVMEGNAGTVLIFDNNLIHKGTAPLQGFRHLAQIEIYPSLSNFSETQIRMALVNPIIYDYPVDPAKNDIAGDA
jgi:hypothetical protein